MVRAEDIEALARWRPGRSRRTRSPSCRRACCCRTSPACRRWSTSPRCATRWRRSAAIPTRINPLQPVELVIDHSVQVDEYGTAGAFQRNAAHRVRAQPRALRVPALGPERVRQLPRGAAGDRHRAPGEPRVPGARGDERDIGAGDGAIGWAYPDTLVGTDSHTTMINGLGVLGWGVGGIEAEAAMLGQPISMLMPAGGRLPAHRRAAERRHRDRSRADRHADAARAGRGRQVRRVLRPRARIAVGSPIAPPSPTWRRSTAPPAASSRSTRATLALPAPHRPRRRADRAGRGLHEGAGTLPRRGEPGGRVQLDSARARPRHGRALPRRSATAAGPRAARRGASRLVRARAADVMLRSSRGRDASARARRRRRRRGRTGGGSRSVEAGGANYTLRARLGGDRRDHQLHQHLEPVGDDRRRPAGEEGGRARARAATVGQDQSRAGLEGGDRLPGGGRPARRTSSASASTLVGYGCTTCIGNSGPLRPEISQGDRATAIWSRSRCSRATATSRVASARRCAPTTWPRRRWWSPTRSPAAIDIDLYERAARRSAGRHAGLPARRLADSRPRSSARVRRVVRAGDVPDRSTPTSSPATSAGASCRSRRARPTPGTPTSTYVQQPPFFDGLPAEPPPLADLRRRARARGARRLDHHRPHLAGGIDQGRQPGRQVPDRARRRAGGLQLLRRAARQPRSDDARHLRQRPPAQPAGARSRGRRSRVHLPERRADDDLRRRDALPRAGSAAGDPRRQGVRHRLLARLGGQGPAAARRARGDRRELRAHPSLQPGRHGHRCRCSSRAASRPRASVSPARRPST